VAHALVPTMEAERELPPILCAVFARDPHAYEGGKQMAVLRRRAHLLGIFYGRDPKAQGRHRRRP
jgi:hypothetical protein